jgi:K+-transporting ATPase ATPase C chain
MISQIKTAILFTVFLTVLTGIVYPLAVTGLAQTLFRHQANGSLIEKDGRVIGSELIGQNFTKPEYFHPRPSAAGQAGYDATASGGSNLGPTNPALADRLAKSATQFRTENPEFQGAIPADAITTSGSGLDPEISPANALAQSARVAAARGVAPEVVRGLIARNAKGRTFGILGEPRVNVLALNLALDQEIARK